jgi:hypothetical protein
MIKVNWKMVRTMIKIIPTLFEVMYIIIPHKDQNPGKEM